MKNPEYFRLIGKDGNFVGFKRIVTEYLPAAAARWQLDTLKHDSEATIKLNKPAMGIATLGREKIVTSKQRRVTHPKSKDHNEPTPVPSKDEDTAADIQTAAQVADEIDLNPLPDSAYQKPDEQRSPDGLGVTE